MNPALGVGLLWVLFGGTHVGLATWRPRAWLIARLGEWGFTLVFFAAAAVSFTLLASYYAAHRSEGPPGLAVGGLLRAPLMVAIGVGLVLALASLTTYGGSTYARGGDGDRPPRGLERVTRHPFFAGTALAACAHALLATHLVGTVFFAGLALLSTAGAAHQDRKLLALRGETHAGFLAATSAVPFAAILRGRQRLVAGELPWAGLALALLLALWLRHVHARIFAHGGAWVIAVVVGGAAVLLVQDWARSRRGARGAADDPALLTPAARGASAR